jgi:hypothetical protein
VSKGWEVVFKVNSTGNTTLLADYMHEKLMFYKIM